MPRPPSLRRRRLAAALRRIREDAGLTLAQAAEAAEFSQSKVSRVEALQVSITGDDTRTLCEALCVDEQTTAALAELARQGNRRGWWHVYDADVLGKFVDYIELATDAAALREFEVDVVPGLLQTQAYADAVIRHAHPDRPEQELKDRVRLRRELQDRALDSAVKLWMIIDEAALRRPVGGAATMAAQLDMLVFMADRPGVTVQVLPLDISGHPALGVPFTIIDLKDGATFGYLETLGGGAYLEEPPEIEPYTVAWSRLQAMALDFDRSVSMIAQIAAEHRRTADGREP